MLSESSMKQIQHYLSIQNGFTAIMDLDFNSLWESSPNFLQYLDLSAVKEALPIEKESFFSIQYGSEKFSADVIPVFRSKKQIGGYTIKIISEKEAMKRFRTTSLNEHFKRNHELLQYELSNIISLNQLAAENPSEKNLILRRQMNCIYRMLICSTNLIADSSASGNRSFFKLCNVSELLGGIVTELQKEMELSEKTLIFVTKKKNLYAELYDNSFVLAFMNLFHNILVYASAKAEITLTADADEDNIIITVCSKIKSGPISDSRAEQAGFCLATAQRIFEEDCDGTMEISRTNSRQNAIITIKREAHKSVPKTLNSSCKDYISGKLKPVHLFVNELIENEKSED